MFASLMPWLERAVLSAESVGQGVAAAQKTLTEKPELSEQIVAQIMAKRDGVAEEDDEKEEAKAAPTEKAEEKAEAAA